jgi:thymidylate synthase
MYFRSFKTAEEAFEELFDEIIVFGEDRAGTKTIYNVGILIENPSNNSINTNWRKWNKEYADYEWQWYLSGNKNAVEISKKAKIWSNMMDENGNVNSNYGYQWQRNNQLDKAINLLKKDNQTRKASISLYDGKEIDQYSKDTVCTYAINFYIKNNKLCMQVMMRSNDLVYGFCNDQYCFSKLQEIVANKLNKDLGEYFHYVCNMHIYEKHFNLKNRNI